ncbi:MAG: tetratricopeptide repeat protein [Pyrinomonadaceae bacterium]
MIYKECQKFFFIFPLAVFIGLVLVFSTACNSEASKQKHLARGEEFLQKRKFQEAAMEFRAAADIDKNSADAHWGLARVFESQGQIYEAVDELRQVIQLAPNNLDAKVKLGNYFLLFTPPQTDETQKLLDEVFAVNPNFLEAHILKASLLAAENKPENEIVAALNHAIELDPKRVESYISLARFYMQSNKAADAEKTIQKAISVNDKSALVYLEYGRFFGFTNRPAEAEAQFKKAVEVEPSNLEAREAIADFYLAQKQLEKAEQAYKDLAQAQGNSPEGLTTLANFYAGIGRDADAIQVFQNILKDNPEYARARYRLGEIYLDRKENEKVSEQVEKLLAVDNSDAEALLLRARMNLQQNDAENAVKDLEEILKKQPSQKNALYYMTEAKLALGQTDEARAFIGDLEKYHPNYLGSKLLQIQASFAANDDEKALAQANDLIDKAKNAAPNADTDAQQLEELRVRALNLRGTAYLNLGKLAEARADFAEVQKRSPNSANAYVNLARVSQAAKNQIEAQQFYEKALALDAKNFDALSGLVSALEQQKQFAAAHDHINQAMQNAAQNDLPPLYYLNADIFQAEKNMSAATEELKKAMAADENYLPAYSAYAAILIRQNQTEAAVKQYQTIVEKKPSAAIYTLLGMLEDARQNFDESEKDYRKALEITPNAPIAANNLAWNIAAYDRGNLDEALRLAQSAVDRNSANAGFYDTLGLVYLKKGLYPQAVEQAKKAVALDAADSARTGGAVNPGYRVRLGQALAAAGDKPNARKEVEIALQNQKDLSESEMQSAKNLLAGL